jgi:MFS family permease
LTTAGAASSPAPTARSLWRHPDFLRLWTAETVSQFGSQITGLAMPLAAILVLAATPFEVGLLNAMDTLPFLLVGLPAGVWVDRLRRRPILIVADLGRAALLASIPIAFVLGVLSMPQLYVVGLTVGMLTVFFDVAYQSYLPALVDRERLVDGNAKLEISRSAAAVAGPPVGGGLVGVLGAPIAIALDAASFVASAVFLLFIRKPEPAPEPHLDETGERVSMLRSIREGLAYVGRHRLLRSIAACTGTANLFGAVGWSVLVLYAVQVLGLTPGTIGIVFGVGSIGFLIGALLPDRIQRRIGLGPAIVASAFVAGLALFLVPLAPQASPLPFLLASQVLVGMGQVVYNVSQVSLRQAITPDAMLGRMNATMRFVVWGTMPLGAVIGGILGGVIGLHETLYVAAIGETFAFLFVLLSPVRSLRTIEQAMPGR